MKKLLLVFVCLISFSCSNKKKPILGETDYQKEQNAFFKDASTSPLKEKDRKSFEGLDFFKNDSSYVVKAYLKRTPNSKPFKMKTSTDRLPIYKLYGELIFNLKGVESKLNIYQNVDKENIDYLFLPFLDQTNGETTYSGGRYIEMSIPKSDSIIIDFNKAFNPYCAYNDKYSCPIVPKVNRLRLPIMAGVKAFKKY